MKGFSWSFLFIVFNRLWHHCQPAWSRKGRRALCWPWQEGQGTDLARVQWPLQGPAGGFMKCVGWKWMGALVWRGDLHRYLYLEDSSWTTCLLQYGGHSDVGEFLLFPKRAPYARTDGNSWPHWHTLSSPGEVMWLQVGTAEQINSNTSLLLDSVASLLFNQLKFFEELKYAELCLKLNYGLSCSCSTVWCFQAISELLGWVFFFSLTIKRHPILPCCFKAWVFQFCGYFKLASLKSLRNQPVSLSPRHVFWKHCQCHKKLFQCTAAQSRRIDVI